MFRTTCVLLVALLLCPAGWAQETEEKLWSGQTEVYEDTINGFRLSVPVEFKLQQKGLMTDWLGPMIDAKGSILWVNATPMKGIHPQALYDGVLRAKKNDVTVTDVTPMKFDRKLMGKPVLGFWCKEVTTKPGTKDKKVGDEPHRWHLFVWGNERAYQCSVAATYSAFETNQVQDVYLKIVKSFQLVPIK